MQAMLRWSIIGLEFGAFSRNQSIKGKSTVKFSTNGKTGLIRLGSYWSVWGEQVLQNDMDCKLSFRMKKWVSWIFRVIWLYLRCSRYFLRGKTPIASLIRLERWIYLGRKTVRESIGWVFLQVKAQDLHARFWIIPLLEASEGVDLLSLYPNPTLSRLMGLGRFKEGGEKLTYHWTTDLPINNYGSILPWGYFKKSSWASNRFPVLEKSQCMFGYLQEIKAKAKGNSGKLLQVSYRNSWENTLGHILAKR